MIVFKSEPHQACSGISAELDAGPTLCSGCWAYSQTLAISFLEVPPMPPDSFCLCAAILAPVASLQAAPSPLYYCPSQPCMASFVAHRWLLSPAALLVLCCWMQVCLAGSCKHADFPAQWCLYFWSQGKWLLVSHFLSPHPCAPCTAVHRLEGMLTSCPKGTTNLCCRVEKC